MYFELQIIWNLLHCDKNWICNKSGGVMIVTVCDILFLTMQMHTFNKETDVMNR